MAHNDVPISIDKTHIKTPTPTTGSALFALGQVGAEYDLWLEVPGPHDDLLINNDGTSIEVKPGSHYYTSKKTLNPGND